MKKLTISIGDDTYIAIQTYCALQGLSMSGFISACAIDKINSIDFVKHLSSLTLILNELSNGFELTEEQKAQLAVIETLVKNYKG